jgi:hypothetical protein
MPGGSQVRIDGGANNFEITVSGKRATQIFAS